MNHKYKILTGALLGAVIGIPAIAQQFYQCVPCETAYDCSSGSRVSCPDGKICLNGTTYNKSSCIKKEYKKITSTGSSSVSLSTGYYEIEIAGAGGGGGGSHSRNPCSIGYCCSTEGGGNGGNGAKITQPVYITTPQTLSYTVGKGGSGSSADCNGCWASAGGSSSASVNGQSWSACGGSGGQCGVRATRKGSAGSSCGNGQGGSGGTGKGDDHSWTCDGESGRGGSDGWIIIYKYEC